MSQHRTPDMEEPLSVPSLSVLLLRSSEASPIVVEELAIGIRHITDLGGNMQTTPDTWKSRFHHRPAVRFLTSWISQPLLSGSLNETIVVGPPGFEAGCLPFRSEVEGFASLHARINELSPCGLEVGHHQGHPLVCARRHLRDRRAGLDRAFRSRQRQLYDAIARCTAMPEAQDLLVDGGAIVTVHSDALFHLAADLSRLPVLIPNHDSHEFDTVSFVSRCQHVQRRTPEARASRRSFPSSQTTPRRNALLTPDRTPLTHSHAAWSA